jgi:hypothetical protein
VERIDEAAASEGRNITRDLAREVLGVDRGGDADEDLADAN